MKSPQKKSKAVKIIALTLSVVLILGVIATIILYANGSLDALFKKIFNKKAEEEKFVPRDTINASLDPDVKYFDKDTTKKIEASITYGQQNPDYLYLEVNNNSPLSELEVGDCFMMQGDEESAFGSAYFGKIQDMYSWYDYTTINIVTPSVYEIFDDMDMDILQKLDYSNMESYEVIEGDVEVRGISYLEEADNNTASSNETPGIDLTQEEDGIGISLKIDLLKLLKQLGKEDSNKSENNNEVDEDDADNIEVYYTKTGICYHRGNCVYVSRNDYELTCNLNEAIVNKSLRPCTVCRPPYFDHYTASPGSSNDDSSIIDPELTLEGSVKLTDITVAIMSENGKEWNLEEGFENLSIKTTGNVVKDVTLSGNCSVEFEQDDTSIVVNNVFDKPFLTVEGLKEKMIPFLYCSWNGATIQISDGPDSDDLFKVPLSIGILFYTDLYGNISIGCELSYSYTQKFEKNIDIFKDGKFLGIGAEKDTVDEPIPEDTEDEKFDWSFKAEIEGEHTFEMIGASMMLYVANINILELKLATIIMEGEFSAGFDSERMDEENYGFYAEGDARIHLDAFTLNVKASVEGFGGILDLEIDCTLGPLIDYTIWSLNKLTERDIVLVLDVSGSMDGTAIREAKAAAVEFVNTIFENEDDVSVGIVTYDSYAEVVHSLTNRKDDLITAINNIYSGGSTDIESGLLAAENMLNKRNAKKKAIVLLSDGLPNEGKVGEDLIDYAKTIKDQKTYIFTLGFFQYLSGDSKLQAQQLMGDLASEGLHYEVSDVNDLVDFFGDIGEQLSGQKYVYIRIACPVDVTVTYNGETLCSKDESLNTRTDFGTLTFEENDTEGEPGSDNRIKVLRLKEGVEYDIEIDGNGKGTMNYSIGFMDDDGEYSDLREFKDIEITRKTKITTSTEAAQYTYLYIDEDGDGKTDTTYKASAEEEGVKVKNKKTSREDNSTGVVVIVVVVVLVVAAGATVALIYVYKIKPAKLKQKAEEENSSNNNEEPHNVE